MSSMSSCLRRFVVLLEVRRDLAVFPDDFGLYSVESDSLLSSGFPFLGLPRFARLPLSLARLI